MDTVIRQTISLFIDNYRTLKKPFLFKTTSLNIKLCALSYALQGVRVRAEDLHESAETIRKNTKWFSPLRFSRILLASFLSGCGKDMETAFERLKACYRSLKKAGFRNPIHLPAASMALFATSPDGLEQYGADSAKIIFNRIRNMHPFLTSSEVYVTSIVMSGSGRTDEDNLKDLEETLYHMKDKSFYASGALQFLAGFLAYDKGAPLEKADKCSELSGFLSRMKFRIPSLFYGIIGLLSLAGDHLNDAFKDTLDTVSLLKLAKCFNPRDREHALLFASAIVIDGFLNSEGLGLSDLVKNAGEPSIHAVIEAQVIACAVSESAITVVVSPA